MVWEELKDQWPMVEWVHWNTKEDHWVQEGDWWNNHQSIQVVDHSVDDRLTEALILKQGPDSLVFQESQGEWNWQGTQHVHHCGRSVGLGMRSWTQVAKMQRTICIWWTGV